MGVRLLAGPVYLHVWLKVWQASVAYSRARDKSFRALKSFRDRAQRILFKGSRRIP